MAKSNPGPRSVKHLRKLGFIVDKVEQKLHIPGKHIKRDAFGIGDYLIAKEGFGVALLQVTSTDHLSHRQNKAIAIPELAAWLAAGGRFLLHGWDKRGEKRKLWTLAEREITLENLKELQLGR